MFVVEFYLLVFRQLAIIEIHNLAKKCKTEVWCLLCRGVGCIFTEIVSGVATFPGMKDAMDQLDRIWRVSIDVVSCKKYIVIVLPGFQLELEKLEKWEGIFQSGKSQRILNKLEKSGKITQNTGELREFQEKCYLLF